MIGAGVQAGWEKGAEVEMQARRVAPRKWDVYEGGTRIGSVVKVGSAYVAHAIQLPSAPWAQRSSLNEAAASMSGCTAR